MRRIKVLFDRTIQIAKVIRSTRIQIFDLVLMRMTLEHLNLLLLIQ